MPASATHLAPEDRCPDTGEKQAAYLFRLLRVLQVRHFAAHLDAIFEFADRVLVDGGDGTKGATGIIAEVVSPKCSRGSEFPR